MNQKKVEFDIAIIGAGIAGLALANALDNTNLKVIVLEAGSFHRQPPDTANADIHGYDARVSAITLGNMQYLQSLGAWDQVSQLRFQPFDKMHVWDGEGTGNIDFDAAELGELQMGAIVENRVLVYSLLDSLVMSGNIRLQDNACIDDIAPITEADGVKQQITLSDRTITAQLVVGADGANSFVRHHFDFKTREWDYGHNAIVCTVQSERPHKTTAWQRFMRTGPVAFLPLPGADEHLCSIVWSCESDKAEQLMALDDEAFCQALTSASEAVLGNVQAIGKRFSVPLRQRHAVDYVQPGVALVADAAHTIHPLAGLGINLGLQDVRVLAEELQRARQRQYSVSDVRVLSRYQRRRKGENLLIMSAMEGFKRLFEQQSLPLLWLRNKGISSVGKLTIIKRQLMRNVMGL